MTAPTALLDELVPVTGRQVVDVGCGDGWLVRRLAQRGATVVGVEPAETALAAAGAAPAVTGERYLRAGAEALPLADRSCDAAIFFNSLHHVAGRRTWTLRSPRRCGYAGPTAWCSCRNRSPRARSSN